MRAASRFDQLKNKYGYTDNHQEGGNLVYADGHGRFRRHDSLRSGDSGLVPADRDLTRRDDRYTPAF